VRGQSVRPRGRPPEAVRPRRKTPQARRAEETFELDLGARAGGTAPMAASERTVRTVRPTLWAHPWSGGLIALGVFGLLVLALMIAALGVGGLILAVFLVLIAWMLIAGYRKSQHDRRLVLTTHRMLYHEGPRDRPRCTEVPLENVTHVHSEHFRSAGGELDAGHLIVLAGPVKLRVGPLKRLRSLRMLVADLVKRAQARSGDS
jgi:hypothetical protein